MEKHRRTAIKNLQEECYHRHLGLSRLARAYDNLYDAFEQALIGNSRGTRRKAEDALDLARYVHERHPERTNIRLEAMHLHGLAKVTLDELEDDTTSQEEE